MPQFIILIFFLFPTLLFAQVDDNAKFELGLSYVDRFNDRDYAGSSFDFGFYMSDHENQDFDFGFKLHFQRLYMPNYSYSLTSEYLSNFRASVFGTLMLFPIPINHGILSTRVYVNGNLDLHYDFYPTAEPGFMIRWSDRFFNLYIQNGMEIWGSTEVHWLNRIGIGFNLFEVNNKIVTYYDN